MSFWKLSQILPVKGGLLVPGSLIEPPVNGYYGSWPWWVVLVIVFPLRVRLEMKWIEKGTGLGKPADTGTLGSARLQGDMEAVGGLRT